MWTYTYMAKDEQGRPVEGSLPAASREEVLNTLRARGLTVIDIGSQEADREVAATESRSTPSWRGRAGVSLADKALLCRQLAVSVNAGVALLESLESIASDAERSPLGGVLQRIIEELRAGRSFSQALAHHPRVFDAAFVAVIRAAEESGSLPRTLEYLAAALERSERLGRKLRSIAAYPLFVAVFFLVVCVIMTVFILPQFQEIFAGYHARLPLITRVVFRANQFLLDHARELLVLAVVLVAAGALYVRTAAGRMQFDRLKHSLPLVGPWMKKYAIARFCRHLAMMVQGGVPVASAFELAAAICANRVLEAALENARRRIVAGSDIATSLSQENVFPRLVVRMVHVGENSGKLPEVLEKVSDVYEDQVEGSITVAMALFEPVVIVLFGLVIMVLVLAIYVPVFSMAAKAQ